MKTIIFKSTRKTHSSGYGIIEKRGDLQYDHDSNSFDGIWLYTKDDARVFIDFDLEKKEFRLVFDEQDFKIRQ